MTPSEFIGHCTCSWRYNKLLWTIETQPLERVNELYSIHQTLKKNYRYHELQKKFDERYERERNGNTTN